MKTKPSLFIFIATFSCLVAIIGDFTVTFLIGFFYKDYNFLTQSESYLGTAGSPVAVYMNTWEIIFSVLFIVYAFALRKTIFAKGFWPLAAVWLIVIYGLGEGIGSGLFPYNHIGNKLTLSGLLHVIFGAVAGAAMVLLPFVLLKIFPRQLFPKMNVFARVVGISGPVLIVIFLMARQDIIPLKGLWQRLFLLDYYLLMMGLTVVMIKNHTMTTSIK